VSVSSTGIEANAYSSWVAISPHGRYVAFTSDASNLVPGDTNQQSDVFVRDRRTGTTSRVSVSSREVQASWPSEVPSISARGRYVSFVSYATDLVPGDTNEATDVFVRDRWKGTTRRVSVSSTGVQGDHAVDSASMSKSGRYVTFVSGASTLVPGDTNDRADVFVRDRRKGTTRRVSLSSREEQADNRSERSSISANGRYVAFDSLATNMVHADTNDAMDVFVRDRWRGNTRRVSVNGSGAQADAESSVPWISSNGRFVGFESYATNLVPGDTNETVDSFVWTGPSPHRPR
jgi:tricorn protease-like protein